VLLNLYVKPEEEITAGITYLNPTLLTLSQPWPGNQTPAKKNMDGCSKTTGQVVEVFSADQAERCSKLDKPKPRKRFRQVT
jgi:hypothetical protein